MARFLATLIVSVVLLALAAGSALAATTAQEGYAPHGDRAEVDVVTSQPREPGRAGTLPFTGLDVAMLAGAGATLLLVGLGMSRMARRESRAAEQFPY